MITLEYWYRGSLVVNEVEGNGTMAVTTRPPKVRPPFRTGPNPGGWGLALFALRGQRYRLTQRLNFCFNPK